MQTPLLDWLRDAPLWAAGAALFALQIIAREAGAALQNHRNAQRRGDRDPTQTGFVVSAILGLLALLIGFTFSLALTRFEARQLLANQEAQALSIVHDRLSVYRDGDNLKPAIKRHAQNRWRQVTGATASDDAAAAAQRNGLWIEAVAIAKAEQAPPLVPFLLTPLGEAFAHADDLALERARRIDGGVLSMLVVLAMASALTLGLTAPSASMRWISTMLFALLTMALLTILDLDQPNSGRIRLSDQAWRQTLAAMDLEPQTGVR